MNTEPVVVVGLGYVGACLATVLVEAGAAVRCIDEDPSVLDAVLSASVQVPEPGVAAVLNAAIADGRLTVADNADLAAARFVVLCVSTPPTAEGQADLTNLLAAVGSIAPHLSDECLVMIRSTVPPGTTTDVIVPILERAAAAMGRTGPLVASCPERLAEGTALADLRSQVALVGATSAEAESMAVGFWADLGIDSHVVSNPHTAELTKLASNVWIDVNIALATELARLCAALGGIDVLEVIGAANTLPKGDHHVNYLLPSVGVGGSCLTKDPGFLIRMGEDNTSPQSLTIRARQINDEQPMWAARRLLKGLSAQGRPADEARVAVLGLAFKTGTGDVRSTPAGPFVEWLQRAGATVRAFDPLARDLPDFLAEVSVASISEAVAGAHAVAVLAGHVWPDGPDLRGLVNAAAPGCILFDGRLFLDRRTIAEARSLGLEYIGIGR